MPGSGADGMGVLVAGHGSLYDKVIEFSKIFNKSPILKE